MAVDKIPPQIQLLHEMHRIACLEQVLFLTSGFVQKSQCVLKTCLCIWFANWCVDLCVTVFLSLFVFVFVCLWMNVFCWPPAQRSRKDSLLLVLPIPVLAQSCKMSNILHEKLMKPAFSPQLNIIRFWALLTTDTSAKFVTFRNFVPGHFLSRQVWNMTAGVSCSAWNGDQATRQVLPCPWLYSALDTRLLNVYGYPSRALKLYQLGLQHLNFSPVCGRALHENRPSWQEVNIC